MTRETYHKLEAWMLSRMTDSAHDPQHIYRVLYAALDIAGHEEGVDYDVLIAACLLHDVGRDAQFRDPTLCHAAVGAEMTFAYLTESGFDPTFARRVADCVRVHRSRDEAAAGSVEAQILFDADKLDVCGAIGVARTMLYQGTVRHPICTLTPEGRVRTEGEMPQSFVWYYNAKLKGVYDRFLTRPAAKLAAQRRAAAEAFYDALIGEINAASETGTALLNQALEPEV